MKKILIGLIALLSLSVFGNDCIIGSRFERKDVEEQFRLSLQVDQVKIKSVRWSASAYNPMGLLISPTLKYKVITLEVQDGDERQLMSGCAATYFTDTESINIHSCEGDRILRMGIYANYAVDTFTVDLSQVRTCEEF